MADLAVETIQFPNGTHAHAIRVHPTVASGRAVDALGLPRTRALLVLNGGTAELEGTLKQQLQRQIADGLARVAAEEQITLVTGGTDAGVFALLGQGLSVSGRTAPCIGVAVDALAQWPGHPQGEAPLEPHHSHFVLVKGQKWGAETDMMYALVHELAQHCPSVAVFAGGGEIVKQEMEVNVKQGRTMILLGGSGRATDAVLAARDGRDTHDPRLVAIAQKGNIVPFDMQQEPAALRDLIRRSLAGDSA
jgi:hypothetical protein